MGDSVKVVPFSEVTDAELAPGSVFYASGIEPAVFVRIVGGEAGVIRYEALFADGGIRQYIVERSGFPAFFVGATLKHKGIMPDCEWQAFAGFLGWVSRCGLDRGRVWKLFSLFQDMDIEREAAELARRRRQ